MGTAGARLLCLTDDSSAHPKRKRLIEPSLSFLKHTLAVAETHVQLVSISDRHEDIELLKADVEPSCWRSYVGDSGAAAYVKPDLYIETATSEYAYHWFFEIDLDSESPSRIVRKCEQYCRYYRSETKQRNPRWRKPYSVV
ncbi:replication-relaxation family protein [Sporobacter termitidis]|uniref:replication-relaxation family protein n=1 Tax=Sporobacter termitidis TaxID=44749 RepID=UPI003BFA6C71